jgi:hypothetical protein
MKPMTDDNIYNLDIPKVKSRGDRPVAMSKKRVEIIGDEINTMLWRGRQWAVTTSGIQRLDGTYDIEAGRLHENIRTCGWPERMSQKDDVDIDDFITAWLVALTLHGYRNPPLTLESYLTFDILNTIRRSWL